jgi:hypothetical protein
MFFNYPNLVDYELFESEYEEMMNLLEREEVMNNDWY